MQLIWLNLVIVYAFSSMARIKSNANHLINREEINKPNKILVLLVMIALAMVSGLRSNIGDTFGYKLSYVSMSNSAFMLPSKEHGFYLLQRLLLTITTDPQLLLLTTAVITNILVVAVLYKYSRLFELSIFMYITSGLYIISMNGLRQFLAGAILFTATKYLLDGRWVKYTIIILLATTIHQSAIIFIPLYFLVRRKAWTKTTFFLLLFALIIVIGYNQLSGVFLQFAGDYSQYQDIEAHGANLLRVFVFAAPLIIAFLGKKKLREVFPKSDYIVNLSLVGLMFMIVSTQNWIFARYIIYFGLYNLILMSWTIKLIVKREQKIVYYLIVVLYLAYFYYENQVSLNIQYRSDYLNFF